MLLKKTHLYSFVLLLTLLITGCTKELVDTATYNISSEYTVDQLTTYLRRSLTADGLFLRPDEFNDHLAMIDRIGAKHLSRAIYVKSNEQELDQVIATANSMISQVHNMDAEIIIEAAISPVISMDIDLVQIPEDILLMFGHQPDVGFYNFRTMTHEEVDTLGLLWNEGLLNIEEEMTQMWLTHLSKLYIENGAEAINFLNFPDIMVADTCYKIAFDLTNNVRILGDSLGRRNFVLLTAITNSGVHYGTRSLLDFNSYFIRPKKGTKPIEAALEFGFHDAIYGNSTGATNPVGDKLPTIPYVVFFSSGTSQGKITENHGDDYVWGYDEISWFSILSRKEKMNFIEEYADWIKRKDLVGYLQMPGIVPLFINTPPYREQLFYANKKGGTIKTGYNIEKAIINVWSNFYR